MDQWRTLLFQATGLVFRPRETGLVFARSFDPGMVATFGGRLGSVVEFGGALYRIPDNLPETRSQSQYEVAFAHLLQLLPAFRAAGATDFILHMHRTCNGLGNEEFTRAELQLLASLGCHFFYAARTEWVDDA